MRLWHLARKNIFSRHFLDKEVNNVKSFELERDSRHFLFLFYLLQLLTILYAFASLQTFENLMCLIINNNNISHIILISSHTYYENFCNVSRTFLIIVFVFCLLDNFLLDNGRFIGQNVAKIKWINTISILVFLFYFLFWSKPLGLKISWQPYLARSL
jgi:hypothetical protein